MSKLHATMPITVQRIDASNGDETFVTLDFALERLAGYYNSVGIVRKTLLEGEALSTPFATYRIIADAREVK